MRMAIVIAIIALLAVLNAAVDAPPAAYVLLGLVGGALVRLESRTRRLP